MTETEPNTLTNLANAATDLFHIIGQLAADFDDPSSVDDQKRYLETAYRIAAELRSGLEELRSDAGIEGNVP